MKNIVDEIIKLANYSYLNDEVPVGAVVVKDNVIIGRGFNDRERSHLITGHAEINAINDACLNIGDWRLDDCVIYVTLKPCLMCEGAILDSRIKKVFYLCDKTNVCDNDNNIIYNRIDDVDNYNEYLKMLKLFFENKRN